MQGDSAHVSGGFGSSTPALGYFRSQNDYLLVNMYRELLFGGPRADNEIKLTADGRQSRPTSGGTL